MSKITQFRYLRRWREEETDHHPSVWTPLPAWVTFADLVAAQQIEEYEFGVSCVLEVR